MCYRKHRHNTYVFCPLFPCSILLVSSSPALTQQLPMSDQFQLAMDSHADSVAAAEAAAETMVPANAEVPMVAAEGAAAPPVAAEAAEGTCAKCRCKQRLTDMIERQSCRSDLRYCCKGCHALQTQCQRKGIQLQTVLSEEHLVAFFAEASLQRRDAEEGRLSFMKSRALLKRHMVEEARREVRDGWRGEFLPLSVYEVKGFDTDLIRERADKEIHPILGETFRLDVHSVSDEVLHATVEKRLTELENECLQRRAQSAAAGSMPELDLLLAAEPVERKRKGGALSNEEKEALKRQRKQEKKLEGERKAATAAAVKVLPALKDIKKKLEDKVGKLGEAMEQVPMASHEAVANAQEKLTSTVDSCSKLIEAAATGKAVPAVQLLSHKDLQAVSKQGAAALRSLNDFVRGQKENSNPNAGNGRGKGKKSD